MLTYEQLPQFMPSGVVSPSSLGVIQAEGPDAATFLQGQLTHDVLLLPVGQARLAGYCSAKGRLLASFWVLKISAENFILICHADLIPNMVKRLSMFIMRAKVKISDASALYRLTGLLGTAVSAVNPTTEVISPWHVTSLADSKAQLLHLYPAVSINGSLARALLISESSTPTPAELLAHSLQNLDQDDWQLSEVLSGISMVQLRTSDAFVPQMLNYESVNGVSFKKGCYPGQEVVARSQFRGTLKRRAYLVSSNEAMSVGDEVFSAEDSTQACGSVASASTYVPDGTPSPQSYWGIVSMQTSAAGHALHLVSSQGPALHVHPLPYALLEDV